jgi:pimeloyl-ACP methyl ester carboxylesterase
MPTVTLDAGTSDEVVLAYDELGEPDAEAVLLIAGCGQPAFAWLVGVAPALAAAGYRVITFDNRGVAPSSSPVAPYTVAVMAEDALGLLDHLQIPIARIAGHSMGGWIAETLAVRHPERVRAAAFLGSCNTPTSWEKAITTVERDLARLDYDLPPLFYATETMRYLPNKDLQDDATVDTWLMLTGDPEPWPNPGRLGQYEACLAWSTDPEHGASWPAIARPCLVMAYEHDIDSPPDRAREAAAIIPNASYVEVADTSHLAPFTHADAVGRALVEFFRAT